MPMTEEERAAEDAVHLERERERQRVQYALDRQSEYPSVGDQLDAIWKELNQRRLSGDNLVQDADGILGKILAVKNKYPKPTED